MCEFSIKTLKKGELSDSDEYSYFDSDKSVQSGNSGKSGNSGASGESGNLVVGVMDWNFKKSVWFINWSGVR